MAELSTLNFQHSTGKIFCRTITGKTISAKRNLGRTIAGRTIKRNKEIKAEARLIVLPVMVLPQKGPR